MPALDTPIPAGLLMHTEMHQQPDVLRRLASRATGLANQVRALAENGLRGVAFLARGSSDNAALLGRYAVELSSGLPTCLVAPSILTGYHQTRPRFDRWLLVAASQSGRTPEIITVADRFRQSGAVVIAVTNDTSSDLADAADLAVDLQAGPERAVPATKTVTAQMFVMLAIAAGLGSAGITTTQMTQIPGAVAEVLADPGPVDHLAHRLAPQDRLAVVARGYCYPAALETSLKLQETTGIMAHGFSAADFRHGPIAVCGPHSPAILLAGSGPADDDTRALMPELTHRGTQTATIGTGSGTAAGWPAVGGAGESLLATVRGQQLAYYTAAARGIDPDHPGGLNKVTLTR